MNDEQSAKDKNKVKAGKASYAVRNYGRAHYVSMGKKGGAARMASLTPQERSELAKKAVTARENKRKKARRKK